MTIQTGLTYLIEQTHSASVLRPLRRFRFFPGHAEALTVRRIVRHDNA
jgi:hypothetical protein